ncbi:interleukin-17A-like [Protopterus annectens]|uniref:interleukin-17A-like n=1 Tax=Protopterus annectens TaxID=7888 RepID=UPI001CFB0EAE|nr:interleukin-17A-like [Protopterus annectens]
MELKFPVCSNDTYKIWTQVTRSLSFRPHETAQGQEQTKKWMQNMTFRINEFTLLVSSLVLLLLLHFPHHTQELSCSTTQHMNSSQTKWIKVMIPTTIGRNSSIYSMADDIKTRSLAPWRYRIDSKPGRYPQNIIEAVCHSQGCIEPNGKENLNLNSSPLTIEIIVLQRNKTGCKNTVRLEKKKVTVGCTCTRPSLVMQSTP